MWQAEVGGGVIAQKYVHFKNHHSNAHPGFAVSAIAWVGHSKVQMVNPRVFWHTVSAINPPVCGHRKYVSEWMWLGANKTSPMSCSLLASPVVDARLPKALGHSVPSHSLKTGPCPLHISVSSKSSFQHRIPSSLWNHRTHGELVMGYLRHGYSMDIGKIPYLTD